MPHKERPEKSGAEARAVQALRRSADRRSALQCLRMTATTVQWNAADYAANSTAQQSWARELIAGLHLRGDERVLDVGCGDGKVTAELDGAVSRGSVTGVDASEAMIGFAQKTFAMPNLEFQVMDARRLRLPREFDLVFS